MGGEVCGSAYGAVDDVVEDEDSGRFGDALGGDWIERSPVDEEKPEHGAVEAEDGARCARADGVGVYADASDATGQARDEVEDQVADASEGDFDERADLVEDVHVEADMDDAEVQEAGGEQPPPLVRADGGGAVVATPVEDVERRGLGEGDAARHHGQEDQRVGRDERGGDGVGACQVAHAGALGGGFVDFGGMHASTVLALQVGRAVN